MIEYQKTKFNKFNKTTRNVHFKKGYSCNSWTSIAFKLQILLPEKQTEFYIHIKKLFGKTFDAKIMSNYSMT